jgi:UDP-glucuronate 4-epimerase
VPQKILVTGGAGFIGSHLVDRLLDEGEVVTVLDNFNSFYDPAIKRDNIKPHLDHGSYRLIDGDIRDLALVKEICRAGKFDQVIHLAAMAGVRPSLKSPVLYQKVNLLGTMNILEACRLFDIPDLIAASSSSVYGNNEKVPFSEDDRVDFPISPYASSKKSGELMMYTYHHLYGLKIACLRFFTVYGPRQRPEMAIHRFTDAIMRGEEITLFGDGSSSRDYTYISDTIDGVMACRQADYGYEVINLGRSDTVTLRDLVALIETTTGRAAKVRHLPDQPGDVRRTYADISKAEKLLGYAPGTDVSDGLARFFEWYQEQRRQQ